MRQVLTGVTAIVMAVGVLVAAPTQTRPFLPVDDIQPGMVGVGRTVFAGANLEDFRATIIGVLHNVMGPKRDLILARLDGGPLATTGVIQGMSGSPVYVDGRLIGAVSYSLGSFPKEPIAGITPIAEMTAAVNSAAPRINGAGLSIAWPASPTDVFAAIARVAARAMSPLGDPPRDLRVVGPQSLADLAPSLRPIAAAMAMSGFEAGVGRDLRQALAAGSPDQQAGTRAARPIDSPAPLRPGDAVGMSLMRGDLEMGATGTVTHIDGNKVYAFGHPFLNLGPASVAMTQAHVLTVLPSLESSMKIATLGQVIGTINQDRATAVGGLLGAGPREMEVQIALSSDHAPSHAFTFYVLHDQSLTPLFTYVAILNSLVAYERQTGALSLSARGTVSFGRDGELAIDDMFTGDTSGTALAAAVAAPIGAVAANEFRQVMPDKLELNLHASEQQASSTIQRAWLDTVRPRVGGTYQLQVQLQDYRAATRIVTLPVTMPAHSDGPLTLLVSDAATLTTLEQRELRPDKPSSWTELLSQLSRAKRNNRLYVRLISSAAGTVVAGDTLPSLPGSVQSALQTDATVARAPITRGIVGAWEQRLDQVVRGSRELTLTLRPAQ
ncbi:MAG: SpoIVB peptidase S55 domain-containing protein [Vicinamibacterales bacterium]